MQYGVSDRLTVSAPGSRLHLATPSMTMLEQQVYPTSRAKTFVKLHYRALKYTKAVRSLSGIGTDKTDRQIPVHMHALRKVVLRSRASTVWYKIQAAYEAAAETRACSWLPVGTGNKLASSSSSAGAGASEAGLSDS